MVRGSARKGNKDRTAAWVDEGLKAVMASWEGLTKGMEASSSKNLFLDV